MPITRRKISRFFIYAGDVVSTVIVLIVTFLDYFGLINSLFPRIKFPWPTVIAFSLFIASHFYQRWKFFAYRPRLEIIRWGWEQIASGGLERLYVQVANWPDINTVQGNSTSTSAKLRFYDKSSGKKIIDDIEDVRWQGTSKPQADDYRYQPYDMWAVPIEAGRTRLLYLASRSSKKSKKPKKIYAHCDRSYISDEWKTKEFLLTKKDLYLCISLWSSAYDPKEFWFEFNNGKLNSVNKSPIKTK